MTNHLSVHLQPFTIYFSKYHPFMHPSIPRSISHQLMQPFVHPSKKNKLFSHLSILLFINPFFHDQSPSAHACICIANHVFFHPSTYPLHHPTISLFVCLFFYPFSQSFTCPSIHTFSWYCLREESRDWMRAVAWPMNMA